LPWNSQAYHWHYRFCSIKNIGELWHLMNMDFILIELLEELFRFETYDLDELVIFLLCLLCYTEMIRNLLFL
jgi:hypothetical protein